MKKTVVTRRRVVGMKKTDFVEKNKNKDRFSFFSPPRRQPYRCSNDVVLRGIQLFDVSRERLRQERLRNLLRTTPRKKTHKAPWFSDDGYNS
jgi:hypothetical protein